MDEPGDNCSDNYFVKVCFIKRFNIGNTGEYFVFE